LLVDHRHNNQKIRLKHYFFSAPKENLTVPEKRQHIEKFSVYQRHELG